MKCTRCGAEVEAQRFCIYCGERLHSHDGMHIQRAPSGVMRFRHRTNISQTSLPEVQKTGVENLSENNLASLNNQKYQKTNQQEDFVASVSSQRVQRVSRPRPASVGIEKIKNNNSMEEIEMKDQSQSLRQSRELEALLCKLNGSGEQKSIQESSKISENLLYDESSTSMQSLSLDLKEEMDESEELSDNSMTDQEYTDEDYNSFFDMSEVEGEKDQDVSSTIPVGSGSFARVPSGGFHLVVDSIKSACQGMISRIKTLRKTSSRKPEETENGYFVENESKSHRIAKYAVLGTMLIVIVAVIISVARSEDETEQQNVEIAAQETVAGNEDFAILALDDPEEDITVDISTISFDDDDFSIPELDGTDGFEIVGTDEANAVNEDDIIAENTVENSAGEIPSSNRLTEIRFYNHKDNLMAQVSTGEAYKTNKSCVMREGPASRFDLVKQLPVGAKIQILTDVEEDWVIQGGSVWTKTGHAPKMGPGDNFADAIKGMTIPQPKSRVISAKNWKYVQFGNVYGYVGPACFK